jgi:hypothetical protein
VPVEKFLNLQQSKRATAQQLIYEGPFPLPGTRILESPPHCCFFGAEGPLGALAPALKAPTRRNLEWKSGSGGWAVPGRKGCLWTGYVWPSLSHPVHHEGTVSQGLMATQKLLTQRAVVHIRGPLHSGWQRVSIGILRSQRSFTILRESKIRHGVLGPET